MAGCIQIPRRRWWHTGLAFTSSQVEANRRCRPGAEGGGAPQARVAWLPGGPQPFAPAGLALLCSASPWTTRPGLDYGLGYQGHVQGTFQLWNKMSEEGQGPPLSVQSGGGELSQSPATASGNLQTHSQNEQHGHIRHAQTSKTQDPSPWVLRGGLWSFQGRTGRFGLFTKEEAGRLEGQW